MCLFGPSFILSPSECQECGITQSVEFTKNLVLSSDRHAYTIYSLVIYRRRWLYFVGSMILCWPDAPSSVLFDLGAAWPQQHLNSDILSNFLPLLNVSEKSNLRLFAAETCRWKYLGISMKRNELKHKVSIGKNRSICRKGTSPQFQ